MAPKWPPMANILPFRTPDKKAYDLRHQQDVFRRLSREWRPYLSPSELSVLLLIIDQTVGMSREEWGFSYRMLEYGDVLTAGTGLDKRQLIRIVATLERIGFITVRRNSKGLLIRPNSEWESGPATPRAAERQAIGRGKGKSGDTDVTLSGDTEVTPPVTRKSPIREEAKEKEEIKKEAENAAARYRGGHRDTFSSSFSAPVRMRQRPVRQSAPEKETPPPVAPTPSPTDGWVEATPATTKQQPHRENVKPGSIEQTARHAFEVAYAGRPDYLFMPWGKRDKGMLKTVILNRWEGTAEECHDMFEWIFSEWDAIIGHNFRWMKKSPPPSLPEIGFIVRQAYRIIPLFTKNKRDKWIAQMSDPEERRYHELTVREGNTADEAKMIIAEERAVERMREENAKAKADANRALRVARLEAERAAKLRRRGIHPSSETAKRMAAEEAARRPTDMPPLEDIPDLATLATIPFRED